MGADGKAVADGDGVAQIHRRIDARKALALGDAGEQRLNGAEELVGVDAQGAERLPIGQDVRRFLGLLVRKIRLARLDVLLQKLLQLLDAAGVVQPAHGHGAEAGRGQLFKHLRRYLIVHHASSFFSFSYLYYSFSSENVYRKSGNTGILFFY